MSQLYTVSFSVDCPISQEDYIGIVAVSAGNRYEGYDAFTKETSMYSYMMFQTMPIEIEQATWLKLRFNGTLTQCEA